MQRRRPPHPPASTSRPRVGWGSNAKSRWLRSLRCGAGSARQPGRAPGGGDFCARRPECDTFTTSSLALVPVVCPRRAAFCCISTLGPALWWRAMAIDCCSCLSMARSRRPRRRSTALEGCPLVSIATGDSQKGARLSKRRLVVVVVVLSCY